MKYIAKIDREISASHQLKGDIYTEKCKSLHGHNYKIHIELSCSELKNGMVIDFGEVKSIVDKYDHKNLNDFIEQPTAEMIAQTLYNDLVAVCENRVKIESISVQETTGNTVEVKE
jgi:6-pyruvoyltetrahydropterin/6-carboxytetrahydropterin synthase